MTALWWTLGITGGVGLFALCIRYGAIGALFEFIFEIIGAIIESLGSN